MPNHDHERAVRKLAAAYGVTTDYWNWQERHVVVPTNTMVTVLAALDVETDSTKTTKASLTVSRNTS